ncbi:I78 family peptidase inhibitor [Pseudomonas sp. CGJS7]|uniref:I78 family peptidase inhibitor n=1 Tax=Pseudomonas sp. CGJS7 TaxID=3109348 RepID=UPI0030087D52
MNTHRNTPLSARLSLMAACAFALTAAACSQNPSKPTAAGHGLCNASGLAWAVGKPADEPTGRRLFKESGAGLWRIIAPDSAYLQDQRDDRLNVRVDDKNVITAVDCG